MTSGYIGVLFISSWRMPTLDDTDPLFALVMKPGFYLHHIEVADQDPAFSSL